MLHILDILLHKFQLVFSSLYNVKSYTKLGLMMNEQKIATQNFQTNSHPSQNTAIASKAAVEET